MTAGGVNVDYTLMGGQWDNSKPITFSIAPDGVAWDAGTNNVNATLDAQFGGTSWHDDVAAALQTWAAAANLDFTWSGDGAYNFNASGQSQGDPRFGDIRVAGYVYPTTTIAQTYGPPPNGSTAGGDVKLNTTYNFGPNGQWDFETVMIHELGHSLGLGESPQPGSVMYSYYSGVRHDLSGYDVEGIQSIYGPRLPDSYQAQGRATSATSAVDLSGSLAGNSATLDGLSLDSIGDSEYFAVTAPATVGATLDVAAVANGHSLMSPKVTVIDAATGAVVAADSHPDQYGDTASVSIPGAQPGQRYLIMVSGATSNVFAVGNYSLQVAFVGGTAAGPVSAPVVATPITGTPVATPPSIPTATTTATPTPTAAANPTAATPIATTGAATIAADAYAGHTSFGTAAELGSISGQSIIQNVALASGQDVRVFAFEPASAGLVFLASANSTIVVGDASGHAVASGRGLVGFLAPQAGARYFVVIMSPNNAPVADASFAIQVVPMAAAAATTAAPPTTTAVTVGQPVPAGGASTKAARARKRHRSH